jgi:hypothetical protein
VSQLACTPQTFPIAFHGVFLQPVPRPFWCALQATVRSSYRKHSPEADGTQRRQHGEAILPTSDPFHRKFTVGMPTVFHYKGALVCADSCHGHPQMWCVDTDEQGQARYRDALVTGHAANQYISGLIDAKVCCSLSRLHVVLPSTNKLSALCRK